MTLAQASKYQPTDYEPDYLSIVQLFDYAESLVENVASSSGKRAAQRQEMVAGLVDSLETSTNELTEAFIEIAQADGKPKSFNHKKVEAAFRRIFTAIDQVTQSLSERTTRSLRDVQSQTRELVEALTTHLEHVVAVFLKYVDLSVSRFMHQQQIEEMKQRETHVALRLHQMSVQPL
jgi:hypothetical protein